MVAGLVPPVVRCKCCDFLTWWQDWFLPWSDISAEDMKTYVEARPTSIKAGFVELPMTSRIERYHHLLEIARAVMMMMIQLDDDDPVMKTCADELCQENTFLVKREC